MLPPLKSALDAIPYPAWTCDAFGAVDYVNAAGADYTDLVPAQSGKQRTIWADVIAADQYETFADQLQSAMRTGTAFHREARISRDRTVDGSRWYSISICPIFAADGIVQSWIGIAVEVDDRKRQSGPKPPYTTASSNTSKSSLARRYFKTPSCPPTFRRCRVSRLMPSTSRAE